MDDSSHCSSECYHLKALEDLLNDKEAKLEELRTQLNDVQERCEVYKRQCEQLNLELQAQKIDLRDRMRLTRDAQNQTNAVNESCKCKSSSVTEAHTQTFETDFNHVDSAGTLDWQPAEGQTIADMVKEAAIIAQKSDFVYDEKSKMYYSASTGYYYDSNTQLFYEPFSKIYYSYDEESKSYKFHSQVNEDGVVVTVKEEGKSRKKHKSHRKSKKHRRRGDSSEFDDSPPRRYRKKKSRRKSASSDSLEDGEVNSSDGSSIVYVDSKKTSRKKFEVVDLEENSCDADSLPPSMRLIVQTSETLKLGTLLLVTYNGGTVGRNENFEVCIPDSSISRMHARIDYDAMGKKYKVQDLGSQNGTWVNDFRLSESKNTSDPYTLKHGNTLRFGDCIFKVHIHSGHNTCANCEPGLVQAAVLASQAVSYQQDEPVIILSKDEKEKVRKEQMRLMKKKYGLSSTDYEPTVEIVGYTDRAKERRVTKGSDNPYEKDAEPTSVDKPIAEDNKGFKMLSSMGWSRGQALGHSKSAILEPVNPDFQFDRAGLGARTNYID